MKPLIPILIVATTSLAVASVQFARQSSSQRERADSEMALRQKQDAPSQVAYALGVPVDPSLDWEQRPDEYERARNGWGTFFARIDERLAGKR